MRIAKYFVAVILIFLCVAIYLIYTINKDKNSSSTNNNINLANSTECVSTFRDGGGPYYLPNSPFRTNIAPETNNGQKLIVSGLLLKNDCKTPVPEGIIDIWQANESGNYEDQWYRGQIKTDSEGKYLFETVIPKGYGEGTGYRPPHIHFKVFIDNEEIITSQMFFPESKGTPGFNDAFIIKTETSEINGRKIIKGNHNIILPQYSKNTVTPAKTELKAFFEIYTNGTKRIFTDSKYHFQNEHVFIDPSSPNTVIVKKDSVTWNDFFKTLPMKLSKDCLTTGTGQTFCTGYGGTLRFYLEGNVEVEGALDRHIQEGDFLKVEFK